jgi:preprotein translocase subunit SecG
MTTLITILHIIVCLFLMLTVLLQSGKGGGMGAAFGGGNAATVFGGSGASSFLRRLTAGAGTIFMITSMVLAFLASHNSADALEKFGEQQEKLAADKEAARKAALTPGSGSGEGSGSAGSGATVVPVTPVEGGSATAPDSAAPGSAAPAGTPAEQPKTDGAANPATPTTPGATPTTPGATPTTPGATPASPTPAAPTPAPAAPAPPPSAPVPAPAAPGATTPTPAPPNDRSDRAP